MQAAAGRVFRLVLAVSLCLGLSGWRSAVADPRFDDVMDNARKVWVHVDLDKLWPPEPLVIAFHADSDNRDPNAGFVGQVHDGHLTPFEIKKGQAMSGSIQLILRYPGYNDQPLPLMLYPDEQGVYHGKMSNIRMTANSPWGPIRAEATYHPVTTAVTLGTLAALMAFVLYKRRQVKRQLQRGAMLEELSKTQAGELDLRIGQIVGGYRIVSRLGQGGMATVYAAVPKDVFDDPQKLNDKRVALKLVQADIAKDEDFSRRFRREVEISRRLDHPNIVRIMDWGEGEELFLCMELVDGDTLRALVGGKMVPPLEAMNYLVPLFEAVDYAHRQGVVHRDLKPDNVMVSRLRTLKVMDFGLAKRHDVSRLTRITKSGTALGTPGYMAPEQIMGKDDLGPAVDQYALGVMAYEFLTGTLPYHADDPIALMFKQCSEPPPSLRQFEPRLARALDRAVLKMLSIEPVDRFPDVLTALQAMQEALGMQLSGVHKIHDWQTLGMRGGGGDHE